MDLFKDRFLRQVVFQLKSPTIEMDFDLSAAEKAVTPKGGKALEAIQMAKKRVWSLLELIEDLVWLSRLEVQDIPFHKEWIDVYEALLKRVQVLEDQARQKGIEFKLHGDPQVRLRADKEAFDRVADNLLSNAIKYTPAGKSQVVVEFQVSENWLVMTVQDDGIGIPPKQQKKIFEEFFRASNAKTLDKFGTGLGLSIVKRVMDWHGGKVSLSGEPKQGTKVETWWPLDDSIKAPAVNG
jgi:signal transduction histidine kinase